jgi:glutathione peroxidase
MVTRFSVILTRLVRTCALTTCAAVAVIMSVSASTSQANALLDVEIRHLASTKVSNLQTEFGNKVLLVVNTASKCAYTPQLRELETLHNHYSREDFSVLGFPSNDFASQDPGTEAQIADVCYVNYGVTFPMFEKISVRGEAAHAFFQSLSAISGSDPAWNFHKYLIYRGGERVIAFPSHTTPNSPELLSAIEEALNPLSQTLAQKN